MKMQNGQPRYLMLEACFALAVFAITFGMALPDVAEPDVGEFELQHVEVNMEADNKDVGDAQETDKEVVTRRGI